ncbi:MAG: hypothetical protein Q8920_13320 [Bacillota bacterium]|nr:hypothetical protein [Bacillota bacterium]
MKITEFKEKLEEMIRQGKGDYKIMYVNDSDEIEVYEMSLYDDDETLFLL